MTRFINIPEYEDFFKSLKLALHNFATAHNVNTNRYFADVLFIGGNNKETTFNNLLSMNTGKDLKARELFLLLDSIGTDRKIFLDFLAKRYDLVCSNTATTQKSKNEENIKDLLLLIGGSAGNIFNSFIAYNEDNKLTGAELKELIKISYQSRALLNEFENNLKLKLQSLDYDI
jgi:hypothetical protein